jgi:hypothetical protein
LIVFWVGIEEVISRKAATGKYLVLVRFALGVMHVRKRQRVICLVLQVRRRNCRVAAGAERKSAA